MKKILIISFWVLLSVGLIALMSFAVHVHAARKCSKVNISISRKNADLFLKEENVTEMLSSRQKMPFGQPISSIDVPTLEKLLLTHPAVESGEVFISVSGDVNISLKQRRAIVRVITATGESYYIDDRGFLMPPSDEYTAPVFLVNGTFNDTYAANYLYSLDRYSEDSAVRTPSVLDDVWQLAKRIDADTFMRAQIVQANYTPEKGLILIPRIGNHAIVVGSAADLDDKLRRLFLFYREGLSRTGKWESYSTIDLQYKNQIVCTKKSQ